MSVVENSVQIEGNSIPLEFVQKPWIRNTYLRFRDEKLVVVSSNQRSMQKAIERHRGWIAKHYRQIMSTVRLFDSNSIFYNSKRYSVIYIKADSRPKADINGDTLTVYADSAESANRHIDRIIRQDAERVAGEIAYSKASLIGVSFKSISARRYRKWGMCRGDRTITVNYCISMLPRELQEYVISHEVAHLKQMNHSRSFWSVVSQLCPDYKSLKRQLYAYDSRRREVISQ